jgi:hypothetical protein
LEPTQSGQDVTGRISGSALCSCHDGIIKLLLNAFVLANLLFHHGVLSKKICVLLSAGSFEFVVLRLEQVLILLQSSILALELLDQDPIVLVQMGDSL